MGQVAAGEPLAEAKAPYQPPYIMLRMCYPPVAAESYGSS